MNEASGKDVKRPQLQAALEYLRDGDVLVVHSMDRLCRNLDDLRRIVTDLTGGGVQVQFMKEGLLFTREDSAMSKLLLSVMGAFAEFERALLRERQREGIAIAKKAGVYKGRKPSLTPDRVTELRGRIAGGEKKAALARELTSCICSMLVQDLLHSSGLPTTMASDLAREIATLVRLRLKRKSIPRVQSTPGNCSRIRLRSGYAFHPNSFETRLIC